MAKRIRIRSLNDEVYAALVRRATEAGTSVPELMRREATRLAMRPTLEEWLIRTRRHPSALSSAEVLSAFDDQRGAWPDTAR